LEPAGVVPLLGERVDHSVLALNGEVLHVDRVDVVVAKGREELEVGGMRTDEVVHLVRDHFGVLGDTCLVDLVVDVAIVG